MSTSLSYQLSPKKWHLQLSLSLNPSPNPKQNLNQSLNPHRLPKQNLKPNLRRRLSRSHKLNQPCHRSKRHHHPKVFSASYGCVYVSLSWVLGGWKVPMPIPAVQWVRVCEACVCVVVVWVVPGSQSHLSFEEAGRIMLQPVDQWQSGLEEEASAGNDWWSIRASDLQQTS